MNPQIADLMFTFTKGNLISEAIAYYTHAKISHCQVIVDIGASGTLQVVSAEETGLVLRWVNPEQYDWACILTCPDLNLKQRDGIANWSLSHVGTPYDFFGLISFLVNIDMNNEARVFCSEACYEAYSRGADYYLLDGVDHAYVSPRDLYISPVLETLNGEEKQVR